MKKVYLILFILFLAGYQLTAQDEKDSLANLNILQRVIVDGDTFYVTELKEVYIFPNHDDFNWWQNRRYRRLIYNVKKVYPYAVIAGEELKELNEALKKIDGEKDRKDYIKDVEKEILDKYEDDLKKLTITQGRILIKLIDRETGDTSYELVKELRGNFSAFFWQTLARLFGSNLKSEYDPLGEDKLIEEIIQKIERGLL